MNKRIARAGYIKIDNSYLLEDNIYQKASQKLKEEICSTQQTLARYPPYSKTLLWINEKKTNSSKESTTKDLGRNFTAENMNGQKAYKNMLNL